MMELVAGVASFWRDEELNFEALVMAETPNGEGESLQIQRALEFDDQDRRLGQDTYCLVVTQGPTFYGGVEGWRILPGRALVLRLSADAANELEVRRQPRRSTSG